MTFLELQERFQARLEQRLDDIAIGLGVSRDPESLMRMFHSLAGIAGTYGFHRITDISRNCEEFCVDVMSGNRSLRVEDIARLLCSVEAMREAQESPEPSQH